MAKKERALVANRERAIVSAAIAFGIVILALGFLGGAEDGEDISVTNNPAIDALIPEREAEILQGDQVGIDLADGFAAALTIETSDGRNIPIPTDQVDGNFTDNLGRFLFRPDEGKVLDALPPQSNCVTATYWPIINPDDQSTIRWCFQVT